MFRTTKDLAVRASAILTTSYVAGTTVEAENDDNQLMVLFSFTKGSLTSAELKVEFSNDNSTFWQETAESFTAGSGAVSLAERTFTASGNYRIAIPLKDRYVKISVKGTGTVTDSLAAVRAVFGVV